MKRSRSGALWGRSAAQTLVDDLELEGDKLRVILFAQGGAAGHESVVQQIEQRLGAIAGAVAALVERDRAEARSGERRQLVAPRVGELREAVREHDGQPLALLVHRKA